MKRLNLIVALLVLTITSVTDTIAQGAFKINFSENTGFTDEDVVKCGILLSNGNFIIGGKAGKYDKANHNGLIEIGENGPINKEFPKFKHDYNYISSIVEQKDGKLIVAGNFEGYSNEFANSIARINKDGTRDLTFKSVESDNSLPYHKDSPNTRQYWRVMKLHLQNDGKIIVAGELHSVKYGERLLLTRLNTDGSIDESFQKITSQVSYNFVDQIAVLPNGKIIIAGRINDINGKESNGLIGLDKNGFIDPMFNNNNGVTRISTMLVQSDGKVLLFGVDRYNGEKQKEVFRINSDGTIDQTFNFDLNKSDKDIFSQNKLHGDVNQALVLSDGRFLILGRFKIEGTGIRNAMVLKSNGNIDYSFIGFEYAHELFCGSIKANNDLYVLGQFENETEEISNQVVRYDMGLKFEALNNNPDTK